MTNNINNFPKIDFSRVEGKRNDRHCPDTNSILNRFREGLSEKPKKQMTLSPLFVKLVFSSEKDLSEEECKIRKTFSKEFIEAVKEAENCSSKEGISPRDEKKYLHSKNGFSGKIPLSKKVEEKTKKRNRLEKGGIDQNQKYVQNPSQTTVAECKASTPTRPRKRKRIKK